jgi:hypothetical protein
MADDDAGFRAEALREEGNRLLKSGTLIGLATVASTVALGATCPLCVVGVPALMGVGAYKRWQASKAEEEASATPEPEGTTTG